MELTDAIREHAQTRANALSKFATGTDTMEVRVEVGPTSHHHKHATDHFEADFTVTIGTHQFFARSRDEDLYAAIDIAKDDVTRQIVSYRSRHRVMWRRGKSFIKSMLRREH